MMMKKKCLMSVFICDKDTLTVLDQFLAGFYFSNNFYVFKVSSPINL